MKKFTLIAAALLVGCIAVACIGQERVCTPNGCYFVPARPQVVKQASPVVQQSVPITTSNVLESGDVVVTKSVRQPLRRVFTNQPIRRLFSRLRCR